MEIAAQCAVDATSVFTKKSLAKVCKKFLTALSGPPLAQLDAQIAEAERIYWGK